MDLQTLGYAAATFQRDPRTITAALAVVQAVRAGAAGEPIPRQAQPSMVLNGKRYFHSDEIVDAITWLTKNEAENVAKKASEGAKK